MAGSKTSQILDIKSLNTKVRFVFITWNLTLCKFISKSNDILAASVIRTRPQQSVSNDLSFVVTWSCRPLCTPHRSARERSVKIWVLTFSRLYNLHSYISPTLYYNHVLHIISLKYLIFKHEITHVQLPGKNSNKSQFSISVIIDHCSDVLER